MATRRIPAYAEELLAAEAREYQAAYEAYMAADAAEPGFNGLRDRLNEASGRCAGSLAWYLLGKTWSDRAHASLEARERAQSAARAQRTAAQDAESPAAPALAVA